MKANEVMRLLRISRATLHRYAEKGNIRFTKLPSGIYNYNDEDIYKILNKDKEIFEEIVSLLHCYSMKLYSKRQNNKKIEVEVRNDSNPN